MTAHLGLTDFQFLLVWRSVCCVNHACCTGVCCVNHACCTGPKYAVPIQLTRWVSFMLTPHIHMYVQLCCCDTLVYITYSVQLHIHLQFHQSDLSPHNYEGVFRQLSNKRPLANLPISYHESLLASYALIVGFS